jgi:metal-dependent amidase/aminoacylase/carboxypeptidase family protein
MGTAAAMRTNGVPGKVVLLGTPAEEGGAGKVKLLEAGACEVIPKTGREHG